MKSLQRTAPSRRSASAGSQAPWLPTPDEISERAEQIRNRWSTRKRLRRSGLEAHCELQPVRLYLPRHCNLLD
jgi:hypothetical protein